MKNFSTIFLILVIGTGVAYSQTGERDSLLKVYSGMHSGRVPRDTSMVKLLCRLAQIYRLSVPDSAIVFANEAYDLSEKISYEKGIANSLNVVGTAYFYNGDYPTAASYQKRALAYAEEHGMHAARANAWNSLALAYHYQGNYVAAFDAYLKSLHEEEESRNYPGIVKVLVNIGILYKNQEDFDNAIPYYKRALLLADSLKDSRTAKASIYNNLGALFIEQKKFGEALEYIQQSYVLNDALGNRAFVANCLSNLGFCYLNMDSLVKAEDYLKRALILARDTDYKETQEKSMLNLARLYLQQKKYTEAIEASQKSLDLAQQYNSKENIFMNYRCLADAYRQLGRNDLAYVYLEKAFMLGDSLKSSDNTKRISALRESYELNKKQSEITLLEKSAALKTAEERNIRYGLITLIAGLSIFAGIIYYSFTSKAKIGKKLQIQNAEISMQKELIERINKDLKAKALRAQMNPHFIFNSLNSIQYLIVQKESVKAYDYLAKFSMLLRRVMDNSERDLIPLSEEIEILNLYLQLEALRFDSAFAYTIDYPSATLNSVKVPPLVLQPYVENAIQHGLMPKSEDRQLSISFSGQEGGICCEIKDNGIGRAEAMKISKRKSRLFTSKGLHYTAERIEVMNTILDGKSGVKIIDLVERDKPAGTLVQIFFNYA